MTGLLDRIDAFLRPLARIRLRWWAWPAAMVGMALFAIGASLLFHHPDGSEFVYFPGGTQFGDTCAFLVVTGAPCPQCGMTRSWVNGIRLDLWTAFLYNPAGLALLGWILVGGVIGAARLVTGNPRALKPDWRFQVGWAMFWLIGLYAVPWVLRLFGINPLL